MINLIKKELKNKSTTENGAIGYKSTNSALVDLNYQVSSLREAKEEEITTLFDKAFEEDKAYTIKWLFYARDIREGLGERRLFRICYNRLSELDIGAFYKNLINISEYGRWDDLISLVGLNKTIDEYIGVIIKEQLAKDLKGISAHKPISLLGKWMPSENASSKKTKALAKKVSKLLNMSSRQYRLILSDLRKHIGVVERKTCQNEWNEIDYEKVPSLANLRYKDSFLKHDKERRLEYLESVKSGDKKMNMKAAI